MGQGRGSAPVLVGVLVALHCYGFLASATTWTVGDSQGWSIGPNYTTWAAGKVFTIGDVLFFPYTINEHNVVEVMKADYDACTDTNAISTLADGNTNVTLNATGTQYFLCSVPGHCTAGMKLAITVVAAAAPAQAPSSSVGTPTPTPAPTPTAPTPSSSTPASAPPAPASTPANVPAPSPQNAGSPASPPAPASTPANVPAPSPENAGSPASPPTPSSSTPAATPPTSTETPPAAGSRAPAPSSAPSLFSSASLGAAMLCLAATLLVF